MSQYNVHTTQNIIRFTNLTFFLQNAHRKPNRGKRTFFADDLWPDRIIPFKINYGTYINSMFKEQLYHNSIFKLFFVFIYLSY